jgi:hypothetical protein
MQGNPDKEMKAVLWLLAIVMVPAFITLSSVHVPQQLIPLDPSPSPYGYTRSLTLWLVPIIAVIWWMHRHLAFRFQPKAAYLTIAITSGLGFILDLVFGTSFFTFENREATLGIWTGAWSLAEGRWVPNRLPIEEFGFYIFGIAATLLLYLWADEYWFAAYNIPDYGTASQTVPRLLSFHWGPVLLGLGLVLAAYAYKKLGPHPYHQGLPGYFTFIVFFSVVPTCMLYKATKNFINWRAISFTLFMLLFISLLWEASLAVPYQWWGYRYEQMIGITIGAWCRLPVEAIAVWIAVTFTTVTIYETIKIYLAMRLPGGRLWWVRNLPLQTPPPNCYRIRSCTLGIKAALYFFHAQPQLSLIAIRHRFLSRRF